MFDVLGINFGWYIRFVRPTIMRMKGNKCSVCSSPNNLDLHHKDLELINIDTLIILCRKCHKRWHKFNEVKNANRKKTIH